MVFYFRPFLSVLLFPWELSCCSNHVPDLNGKYGRQMIWLKILPQPTHDMYIHNLLNLFMISINAYFRLEQLIQ